MGRAYWIKDNEVFDVGEEFHHNWVLDHAYDIFSTREIKDFCCAFNLSDIECLYTDEEFQEECGAAYDELTSLMFYHGWIKVRNCRDSSWVTIYDFTKDTLDLVFALSEHPNIFRQHIILHDVIHENVISGSIDDIIEKIE